MGGVISFSDKPDEIWGVVAGWAFRQVLDDVIFQYPEDSEMAHEFDKASNIGGLIFKLLEPELGARIANAIWEVATGILSGTIRSGIHDQPYGDAGKVEQYRKVLQELLDTFPEAWKPEGYPEQSPPR
jgi:hypothetical protein